MNTELTIDRCADLPAWEIANLAGCHYSGDCSPVPHGGFFYDTSNWAEYGYADAVEIFHLEDTDRIVVRQCTINRSDVASALQSSGIDSDSADVNVEIESCFHYMGAEPVEDFSGRYEESFPYDVDGEDKSADAYWNESIVWAVALPWIQGLSD